MNKSSTRFRVERLGLIGGLLLAGNAQALSVAGVGGVGPTGIRAAGGMHLPLHFEPAIQADAAGYVGRGADYGVWLRNTGLRLALPGPIPGPGSSSRPRTRGATLALDFIGANPEPVMAPEQDLPGRSNYFIGSDPSRWRRAVPQFGAVRVRQLYPGVDWLTYEKAGRLEYDLVVAPHAAASTIRLHIGGAERVSLDARGTLLMAAGGRVLRQFRPVVYQRRVDGTRERIGARYVLDRRTRTVGFALDAFDPARELVIDPALAYASYLGGSASDTLYAIAADAVGHMYVAGIADSPDFPTARALRSTSNHTINVIAKLDPSGQTLLYSTYLGGTTGGAYGHTSLAINAAGEAYLATGVFYSTTDYPTVNAFQAKNTADPTYGNTSCGALSKLNAAGSALIYSTYLCGTNSDVISRVAVDANDSAYVAGRADSTDFPTKNAYQGTNGGHVGFVAKFTPDGRSLAYSTLLGGDNFTDITGLAVDAAGSAYVAGYTSSTGFPIQNAAQPTRGSTAEAGRFTGFVTKFGSGGDALVYSSYLGGSGLDIPYAIAVDDLGSAYVAGTATSADFPLVRPYQASLHGGSDAFVTKFSADGGSFAYSTYLGGAGTGNGYTGDSAQAIAVDRDRHAYLAGYTTSPDFPTVSPVQANWQGGNYQTSNAFVSEMSADGQSLLFSTFLGGTGSNGSGQNHTPTHYGELTYGIAVDPSANIYIAGSTESTDFPTVKPFQASNRTTTQYGANATGFVAKFGTPGAPEAGGTPPASPTGTAAKSGGGALPVGLLVLLGLAGWRRRTGLRAGG